MARFTVEFSLLRGTTLQASRLPIPRLVVIPRETAIFNFIKKLLGTTAEPLQTVEEPPRAEALTPQIYPRAEHPISRSRISPHALKVLYRLKAEGFDAYLVGGCVRDLLLGREPKDFDVVTNAHPEQIRKIFRNCRLIGRRFRLAHVFFGQEIVEVATFRGALDQPDSVITSAEGRVLRDNVYGTIEQDVWRRDFTVNALYYNIRDFSLVDYTGGMHDHTAGVLRLIGDAERRYREDPVRMLRAVRFAVKLGFRLHPDTERPIPQLADLLHGIPAARLYDECLKLFLAGYAVQTFEMLRHYGLLTPLFPATERCLALEDEGFPRVFIAQALSNTDARLAEGKPVTPYFLFAALLWEPVRLRAEHKIAEGLPDTVAYQEAAHEVVSEQSRHTAFPKHIGTAMREVWGLQPRFLRRSGARVFKLLEHPRFRAAYDFLLLRAETGGVAPDIADWWTRFQTADAATQQALLKGTRTASATKRRRKRKSKSKTRVAKETVE